MVLLSPLEPIERELLHQVVLESARTNTSITVLVLVYIVLGRIQWPHQEFDCHVTKMVIHPDGSALYEDHAMSQETRLLMSKNYLWYKCDGKGRGEYFYTNNQGKHDNSGSSGSSDNNDNNDNTNHTNSMSDDSKPTPPLKKKKLSNKPKPKPKPRPVWAYVGLDKVPEGCGGLIDPGILPSKLLEAEQYILGENVKIFELKDSWNIRLHDLMRRELGDMKVWCNKHVLTMCNMCIFMYLTC